MEAKAKRGLVLLAGMVLLIIGLGLLIYAFITHNISGWIGVTLTGSSWILIKGSSRIKDQPQLTK